MPQLNGTPGWILLTHNKDGQPEALFVDHQDRAEVLPIVMDTRLYSDTIFRVVRLSPRLFVVYDVRLLNGTLVFEKQHFEDRNQLVTTLLETFHSTELTALVSLDDVPDGALVRGTEYYDFKPGTVGVFLPAEE